MAKIGLEWAFLEATGELRAGRVQRAKELLRGILVDFPDHAPTLNALGIIAAKAGRKDEAIALLSRAVELSPNAADFRANLGNAYAGAQRLEEAVAALEMAIRIKPALPEAHYNLALALHACRRAEPAIASVKRALQLKPDYVAAWVKLGILLREMGAVDEAVRCNQKALELQPDSALVLNNMGVDLLAQGGLEGALACFRKAVSLKPDFPLAYSGLLMALHMDPRCTEQALAEEHARWNSVLAEPLRPVQEAHANTRDPERLLRIGYVSSDLREHAVGRFMLPLLAHHDRTRFEIHCYTDVIMPDGVTRALQAHVDHWHPTAGISDEMLARKIRADGIDILVDLAAHTAGGRLLVFARRPAPVQVAYLAYCSTTGLEAMDYRFSDTFLDPPGSEASYYCERTIRLPSYWCYPAPSGAMECTASPGGGAPVTFGCLGNPSKVHQGVIAAWCEILQRVPGARLVLHAPEGLARQRIGTWVRQAGVSPDRVEFFGYQPLGEYLATYRRIDIALDPFPYAGGTTTCDALWMGVPVITLRGALAVGRGGVSILSLLGKPEWIAATVEAYVARAVALAADRDGLRAGRRALRARMERSPVMDGAAMARGVEQAYRVMWGAWSS